MNQTETLATTNDESSSETSTPAQTPRKRPKSDAKPRLLPPHVVILHNDSINGIDYVVGVLKRVLRCSGFRAVKLTLQAHFTGRAIVWTGSLEVAEFIAESLTAAGADPRQMGRGASPLHVSIEPLPG